MMLFNSMWVSLRTEIKMVQRTAGEQMDSVGVREANTFGMPLKHSFGGHVAR